MFTQLFDASATLVAKQENLPVEGMAPTDTWQPGAVIRDPYRLALPADAAPGVYSLQIGLYDAAGQRAAVIQENGVALEGGVDHVVLPVAVDRSR